MKNFIQVILSGSLLLSTILTNAQISTRTGGATNVLANSPTTNTNVGIGTTNPIGKLEIAGEPNGLTYASASVEFSKTLMLNIGGLVSSTSQNRLLTFLDRPSSNIYPIAESYFSIEDRNDANRYRFYSQTGGSSFLILSDKTQSEFFKINEDGNNKVYMQLGKPDSKITIGGFSDYPNSIGHKLFVQAGSAKVEGNIFTDSNIGIGTSNFVDGADTYRLSVKGKVRAEEIKVYNTWADYVFSSTYKLPTLKEVEQYIIANKHLQNVPSAQEIEKNGLALGEMAKIQQEKIEELTLYIIEQNKRIEALEAKINNK